MSERVVVAGQRIVVRIYRNWYGYIVEVLGPDADRNRRDRYHVFRRVVVDYGAVVQGRFVRGQSARLDVQIPNAKPFNAGVRKHVVTRLDVVVLVDPADRDCALETVLLVFERRGQRFVLVPVRIRGPHSRDSEILITVVREEPSKRKQRICTIKRYTGYVQNVTRRH